jgi:hypothetical protein
VTLTTSAVGPERTSLRRQFMSVPGGKAEVSRADGDFRVDPKGDLSFSVSILSCSRPEIVVMMVAVIDGHNGVGERTKGPSGWKQPTSG